jgi:DNA-binding SARP family transcriptional activator
MGISVDTGVVICLLGRFTVIKRGEAISLVQGSKMRSLLSALALREHRQATRDSLLEVLWPETDAERANQSLNTLVHALRQRLADALAGQPPLVRTDDGYQLNLDAGIELDTLRFDACADAGARRLRQGDIPAAVASYEEALRLYRGDLCPGGTDLMVLIERERLRAVNLGILTQLASHYYSIGEYPVALRYANRLLLNDPCREDAHRVVMRCHARQGHRVQAMRQYMLCRDILHREFQTAPEPATEELFRQLKGASAEV